MSREQKNCINVNSSIVFTATVKESYEEYFYSFSEILLSVDFYD